MAFLYGAAGGTLYLDELPKALAAHTFAHPMTLLAIGLLLVGFGFRWHRRPPHVDSGRI